jgi:hypothetical protein
MNGREIFVIGSLFHVVGVIRHSLPLGLLVSE